MAGDCLTSAMAAPLGPFAHGTINLIKSAHFYLPPTHAANLTAAAATDLCRVCVSVRVSVRECENVCVVWESVTRLAVCFQSALKCR